MNLPANDRASARLAEEQRLAECSAGRQPWKRFGTYLAERQWGTVREDYSEGGSCWDYFPHDHARSRAYRWGEDGLLGLCDEQGLMCFAVALWNGRDPILKERLFGLTGPEGNHGEDVKECYFYLDATPTHSYAKALYKYPQAAFPYARLVEETRRRSRNDGELELVDTGVFEGDRYFDVTVEYAKASPTDVLIRITVTNRGPEPASLHVLPTLWFRNTWSWGRSRDERPRIERAADGAGDAIVARHPSLGRYRLSAEGAERWLFTDNETNAARLFGVPNASPWVKDAFHDYVVHGREDAVNPAGVGTKAAALHRMTLAAGESRVVRLRLRREPAPAAPFGAAFDALLRQRIDDADRFYAARVPSELDDHPRAVVRQAYAALLWSKQLFHYDVREWLDGDPAQPPPPASRRLGRNRDWQHLNNCDVVSMPDAWEYPWYAAWDLAFHMIPFARIDPHFAKEQLVLFTREWFMHPNGQLPAYEFAFGDVNPPVHAWSAWRVYQDSAAPGGRDRVFLSRVFQKLLLNFTWWVNRKDSEGRNLFGGGFLGLDNIGVFDRSQPLPTGGSLQQADGTAWMAFYCGTMLAMALELAREDPAGEDMATKFFEHFIAIADAMNRLGGSGLWCERDGFYYDQLLSREGVTPLRVRSLVGLVPLLACEILEQETLDRLPDFARRMRWFLDNRPELAASIVQRDASGAHWLLAIPSRTRLERVLRVMLDENEFLSPYGIRSVSRAHGTHPFVLDAGGAEYRVDYVPGESTTGLFGGNSNWRGPVWFPLNYLLVEALQRYGHFYGDDLRVECPTGSGTMMTLAEVARELERRLASLFVADGERGRPLHGGDARFAGDPHWRDLVRFHEYFHGEDGRGLGASFQGWTTLVARCFEDLARARGERGARASGPAVATQQDPQVETERLHRDVVRQ
ncbi:MAG: glucosidase [Thermodesulfobacteriota bacterium]